MNVLLRSASALAVFASALAASAQTITFENLASAGSSNGIIRSLGSSVSSGGYSFTTTGTNGLAAFDNGNYGSFPGNYTGSVALFNNTGNTTVAMTQVGGGTFGLTSLQVANTLLENDSRTFSFLGTRADGTTVTQSTTITLGAGLTTIALSGFTNLASFTLPSSSVNGPNYQFDNVVVTPAATPEPSTWAAVGLGAGAMLRRRKRA